MQKTGKIATVQKAWIILIALFITGGINAQNWLTDFEAAKQQSKLTGQPIILVFQGSDWCAPCIKMDQSVWATETFSDYAEGHFTLLKADFPRRKKNRLTEEQQEHNNQLAARYNKNGYFPFVAILDQDGKVLAQTGYSDLPVQEFINTFLVPHAPKVEAKKPLQSFSRTLKLMGSRFDITVIAQNASEANAYIDMAVEEIQRIERIISSWDKHSQTSAINNNAGIKAIAVDEELFDLIERALGLSKMTDGAFDITFASMDRIWTFDGSMTAMPASDIVSEAIDKIGFNNVELNREAQSVFLKKKGMKIGFGAIGKGYAADKARELLQANGVVGGIINASGDMNTWGTQADGKPWSIGITNPLNKEKVFATFPLDNTAVATSGDYEKYAVIDGKRYAHIIDPRTGYPASGIISATVFAPKAELADAFATTLFVMGIEAGIDRIDQIPNVECILVDDNGKLHTSKNLKIEHEEY